jgi:hypothetical protein
MNAEEIKAWSPVLIALITMAGTAVAAYFAYRTTTRVKEIETRVETVETVQAAQADVVLTLAAQGELPKEELR